MTTTCDSSEFRRLQTLWEKWTKLITRASLPGWRRRRMTEDQLVRIRQPLLRLCSDLARNTENREKRGLVLRMHELVEPWTTPMTFVNVDQKYLASLITECRALRRELKGLHRYRRRMPSWIRPLLAATVVGGVVWYAGGLSATLAHIGFMVHTGAGILGSTSFVQRFALATMVVISIGILLLQKTRRF